MRKPMLPFELASTPVLPLLCLIACAALLRVGAVTARWSHLSEDPDAYRLIAENLVQRGVFSRSPDHSPPTPTAFRPPLYPLVLTATAWQGKVTPLGVAVLHVVLGSLTVVGVLILGQRWGLGRWSWLAAGLVAADPILLHQASEVMTETMATFLCVLGLLALTQWSLCASYIRATLVGAALGLAILCRPTFLILGSPVWAVHAGDPEELERDRAGDGLWRDRCRDPVTVGPAELLGLSGVQSSRRLTVAIPCCWPTTRPSMNTCVPSPGAACGTRSTWHPSCGQSPRYRQRRRCENVRKSSRIVACTRWHGRRSANSHTCSCMRAWCGWGTSGLPSHIAWMRRNRHWSAGHVG